MGTLLCGGYPLGGAFQWVHSCAGVILQGERSSGYAPVLRTIGDYNDAKQLLENC